MSSTGGIGIPGALFIVFVVLKLTHVIDWSWWWIASPLWIGLLVLAALAVVLLIIALAVKLLDRD